MRGRANISMIGDIQLEHDFALLAPVPLGHLHSALGIIEQREAVCFGSRKFDVFSDLDGRIEKVRREARDRGEDDKPVPIPVLIYPSGEDEGVRHNYEIAWFASYIGHEPADRHGRPLHEEYRPLSTLGESWPTYWYVTSLYPLPAAKRTLISKVPKLGRVKATWKPAAVRGPTITGIPNALSYEKLGYKKLPFLTGGPA